MHIARRAIASPENHKVVVVALVKEVVDGQLGVPAVVGLDDAAFVKELRERTEDVASGKPKKHSDLVFVYMDERGQLAKLRSLRAAIKPAGAIWVVWPKGRKEFREDDVRAAGPDVGLVDVKVVAFSDALSGLKMVIPVAQRPKKN